MYRVLPLNLSFFHYQIYLSSLSSKFASVLLHLVRAAISDRELINKWMCGYNVLESYSASNLQSAFGSGILSEKTDFSGHLRYKGEL